MKTYRFTSLILTVAFGAIAAFTLSAIHGPRAPAYEPLSPSEIAHVDVWTERDLAQIERTGKAGGITVPNRKAFVHRIQSEYLRVESPSSEALNKSVYYVSVGTRYRVQQMAIGAVLLILVAGVMVARTLTLERNASNKPDAHEPRDNALVSIPDSLARGR